MPRSPRPVLVPLVALAAASLLAACSSGSSSSSGTDDRTAKPKPIIVLVTNDDGYSSAGIDAVTTELRSLPGVTVAVVAPATNRSGSGSKTTPGTLTVTEQKTASGYPATAVLGYPADAVNYAFTKVLKGKPDLVVSGINEGANFGPLATISGTVGAAKRAVSRGVPALAASQGLGAPTPDYVSGAKIVGGWVAAHRAELAAGKAPLVVLNLNIPTCTANTTVRGVEQVPPATNLDGANLGAVDCSSTATNPPNDVVAFADGFASVTDLQADGQPTTSTTVWSSR